MRDGSRGNKKDKHIFKVIVQIQVYFDATTMRSQECGVSKTCSSSVTQVDFHADTVTYPSHGRPLKAPPCHSLYFTRHRGSLDNPGDCHILETAVCAVCGTIRPNSRQQSREMAIKFRCLDESSFGYRYRRGIPS